MPTLGRDGLPRMASGDGSEAIKDGKEGEFDAKIDNYTQMKAGITTGMVEELNVLAKEVIEEKEHHDPQWDRERKRKLKNAVRRLKSSMSRQQTRRGQGCVASGVWLKLLPESVRPQLEFGGGKVRQFALAAIEHWLFDQFIMGCILVNCLFLALADPAADEEPEYQEVAGLVFLYIFTLECIFKCVALSSMYFDDYWNWLDLVVVVEGWVSSLSSGGSVLSGLKTLRILRPLRVANRLPALKTIINALLAALPAIFDTFVVFFFFLVMCALICVMLWSGTFHYRCMDDESGEWVDGGETLCFPAPVQQGGSNSGCAGLSFLDEPYTCEHGQTCTEYGETPEGNNLNFDNVAVGFLALFAASTMEGWAGTLYYTQDVMTPNTFAVFLAIIVVGNFTIINLMIAAILVHLEKQQSLQQEDEIEREMEAGRVKEEHLMAENMAKARKLDLDIAAEEEAFEEEKQELAGNMELLEGVTVARHASIAVMEKRRDDLQRKMTSKSKRFGISVREEDEDGEGSGGGSGSRMSDKSFVDQAEAAAWTVLTKATGMCYQGIPRVQTKGHWAYELRWMVMDDASPFSFFIQLCIVFNLVVLAMDGHGVSEKTSSFLTSSNLVLTGVFVFEMALKLGVAGVPEYCSSTWNLFDGVIVTGSVVELMMDTLGGGGGSGGGSSLGALRVVRMLRLMRVARLARLANKSKVLNRAVTTVTGLIVKSSSAMFPVLLLLLLFMFIFAILGMQMFGQLNMDDDFVRFDSFYVAFVQCFYVITGEAWVDVMYVTMATDAGPWAALYFVTMVVIGTFILLNLILAAVLSESLPNKSNVEHGLKRINLCYDAYKFRCMWSQWKWANERQKAAEARRKALLMWQKAAAAHPGGTPELLELAKGLGVHGDLLQALKGQLRRLSRRLLASFDTGSSGAGGAAGGAGSSRKSVLAILPEAGAKAVAAAGPKLAEVAEKVVTRMSFERTEKQAAVMAVAARERLRLGVAHSGDEDLAKRHVSPPAAAAAASSSSSSSSALPVSASGEEEEEEIEESGGESGGGGAPATSTSDCEKDAPVNDDEPQSHEDSSPDSSKQGKSKLLNRLVGAALETLAVTIIQKTARGYVARKNYSRTISKSSEAGSSVAEDPLPAPSLYVGKSQLFSFTSSVNDNDNDDYGVDKEDEEGGGGANNNTGDDDDEEEIDFDAPTWTELIHVISIVDKFSKQLTMERPQTMERRQRSISDGSIGASGDAGDEEEECDYSPKAHPMFLKHAESIKAVLNGDQRLKSTTGAPIRLSAFSPTHHGTTGQQQHRLDILPESSSSSSSSSRSAGGSFEKKGAVSSSFEVKRPTDIPAGSASLTVSYLDTKRPRWMRYRLWSHAIVSHPLFDDAILLAISVSCISMVANSNVGSSGGGSSGDSSNNNQFSGWDGVDYACASLFFVEAVLKCGATELYASDQDVIYGRVPNTGLKAYLADPWNRLDSAIVLSSVLGPIFDSLGAAPGSKDRDPGLVGASAVCAVVRACRPLRVINHVQSLKDTVGLLYKSTLALSSIAIFLGFASVAYAVVGMQLFKGLYWFCEEGDDLLSDQSYLDSVGGPFPANAYRYGKPLMVFDKDGEDKVPHEGGWMAVRPCDGVFLDSQGIEREALGKWRNPTFHFDDFGSALLSVFVLSTEGWAELVWEGLAATEVDYSGDPYSNTNLLVIPYFAFAVCFFGLYLMNLFVGVVFDEYGMAKAASNKGHFDELVFIKRAMGEHMSRKDDHDWAEFKGRLESEKPRPLVRKSEVKWRKRVAVFVESHAFHTSVLCVIGLNAIALAATHKDMPEWEVDLLEWANVGFSLAFAVEATLMLVGLGGAAYFADGVNLFDFVVTVVSLLDSFLFVTRTCTNVDSAFIRLVRSMRVFRLMRLVFVIKGCEDIYLACRFAFERLVNVCLLLGILIFFFANVGWVFFQEFSDSHGSRYANFQSIGGAMQLLFVLMTGDAWTDTFGAMVEEKPELFALVMAYFLFYLVVQYMVMVNLFVMVVCEAFEVLSEESRKVVENMLPKFKTAWAFVDPQASGHIAPAQVEKFLRLLPGPFGVPFLPPAASGTTTATTADARVRRANFRRVEVKAEYVRSSCADAAKKRQQLNGAGVAGGGGAGGGGGASSNSHHNSHHKTHRLSMHGKVAPQPPPDACLFSNVLCAVVALWLSEYGMMPVPGVSESMVELNASLRIADMFHRYSVRFRKAKEDKKKAEEKAVRDAEAKLAHELAAAAAAAEESLSGGSSGGGSGDGGSKWHPHLSRPHRPSILGGTPSIRRSSAASKKQQKGSRVSPFPAVTTPEGAEVAMPNKTKTLENRDTHSQELTAAASVEPTQTTTTTTTTHPSTAAASAAAATPAATPPAMPTEPSSPPQAVIGSPKAEAHLTSPTPTISQRTILTSLSSPTAAAAAAAAGESSRVSFTESVEGGGMGSADGNTGLAKPSLKPLALPKPLLQPFPLPHQQAGNVVATTSEDKGAGSEAGGRHTETPSSMGQGELLPPGWEKVWSSAYSTHFYRNQADGVSSWEIPRIKEGESEMRGREATL